MTISLDERLLKYIAEKGSVTLDGVSLTVVSVSDRAFSVSLIPQTRAMTTLGGLTTCTPVNVEVDVIARYTERLLSAGASVKEEPKDNKGGLSLEWLAANVF